METISYTSGKALSESEGLSIIASYLRSGLSSSVFYKQIGMSENSGAEHLLCICNGLK